MTLRHVIVKTVLLKDLTDCSMKVCFIFERGIKRTCAHNLLHEEPRAKQCNIQNYSMFNISHALVTQIALQDSYFMHFDEDVELV